jgi:hypothetical protein
VGGIVGTPVVGLVVPVVAVVVADVELLKTEKSVSTWSRSYPLKFG